MIESGRKFWKGNFERLFSLENNYTENHINCYVDSKKITSKRVCSNIHHSYENTNIIDINTVTDKLHTGITLIYSKNIAFKLLSIALNTKCNYIYIDNGYFSKFYDKKITKLRIIVNSIHPQKESDFTTAFYANKMYIKPWKERSDSELHILMCPPTGEVIGLFGIKGDWIESAIRVIRKETNRKILIRFKSYDFMTAEKQNFYNDLNKKYKNVYFDQKITDADLIGLFDDCYAVVAPASGVAVIAASYGIPVFSEKFGPVANIAVTDFSEINHPIYPNRDIWLNTLLAHEFTFEDLYTGQWLVRLKALYPRELRRIIDDKINLF